MSTLRTTARCLFSSPYVMTIPPHPRRPSPGTRHHPSLRVRLVAARIG